MPRSPNCVNPRCTDTLHLCGYCIPLNAESEPTPNTVFICGNEHCSLVLWLDGDLTTLPAKEDLKYFLDDNKADCANVKLVYSDPLVSGGPSALPPAIPSTFLQPAQLVNPNDENAQHFYIHLWTILGASKHTAKCTG